MSRYIITCHTTDFECFRRQYKALRDNVLLGNLRFGIPTYEHYIFAYGGGTCVKLAGLEESELVAINMISTVRRLTLVIELPLRIQQVKESTYRKACAKPEKLFEVKKPQTPTIGVSYPYNLKRKKGDIYMRLEEENLDVTVDIPDLSHFYRKSEVEAKLYEWSEWAYEAIQHVDAAENFALPYTKQLQTFMKKIPLHRLIMLYPDETYQDLQFRFPEAA